MFDYPLLDIAIPEENTQPIVQPDNDPRFQLQVGDRHFTTTRDTLVSKSGFFRTLLSDRRNSAFPDGSYFVDADPDLFDYILRYLRRGIFPVCFNIQDGHDHILYEAILQEARYLKIPCLEKWLSEKKFLEAVKVNYSLRLRVGYDAFALEGYEAQGVVEHYPSWCTKKVYICPRGIFCHRDRPEKCGQQCERTKGPDGNTYEEEIEPRMVVVTKTMHIDASTFVHGG